MRTRELEKLARDDSTALTYSYNYSPANYSHKTRLTSALKMLGFTVKENHVIRYLPPSEIERIAHEQMLKQARRYHHGLLTENEEMMKQINFAYGIVVKRTRDKASYAAGEDAMNYATVRLY